MIEDSGVIVEPWFIGVPGLDLELMEMKDDSSSGFLTYFMGPDMQPEYT